MMWDYTKEDVTHQAKADPRWYFGRLLMYGLEGNKIKREDLAQYLNDLKLPVERRAFLELLVWDKQF